MRAVFIMLVAPMLFAACGDDGTAAFVCMPGQSVDVTYNDQGTFTMDTLKLGGVTVTGSATVNVLDLNGLGVVGGLSSNAVDGAEWLRFAFDTGAAVDISYFVSGAGDGDADNVIGEATIEAFDVAGTSLGTVPVNGAVTQVVSGSFSDEPLSAFVVAAQDNDQFRISWVAYTPCQ